jgi:hypothetical protein
VILAKIIKKNDIGKGKEEKILRERNLITCDGDRKPQAPEGDVNQCNAPRT